MSEIETNELKPGRAFWVCLAIGGSMMAAGFVGVLAGGNATRPLRWGLWFFGSAIVHDVLLAPAVFLVARILGRRLSPVTRVPVQSALVLSAIVAGFAIPGLLDLGSKSNPTLRTNDYLRWTLWIVAVLWLLAGVAVARNGLRHRPVSRPAPSPASKPGS